MARKVQTGAALPTADGYIDANGDWQPRPLATGGGGGGGGTVDIDQTIPGTTNGVVVNASALPAGASTSALQGGGLPLALAAGGGLKVEGVAGGIAVPVSGTFYPGTQPVSVAASQIVAGALVDGADLTQGVTTGAGVITDAAGTIQQYLRGLVKLATTAGSFLVRASVASGGIASGAVASGAVASGAVASGAIAAGAIAASSIAAGAAVAGAFVDGSDLTQGVTTGAAVVTDAAGTIQQYLRGIIKLLVDKITVKGQAWHYTQTLTVTNGVYVIGDVVGGLLTITTATSKNAGHGILNTVKLCGVSAIAYELWLFTADVADTAIADQDPLTLAAADGLLSLGTVPISTADYNAGANAFNNATVRGVGLEYHSGAATTSIYGYLKATATTTPGTTTIYIHFEGEHID